MVSKGFLVKRVTEWCLASSVKEEKAVWYENEMKLEQVDFSSSSRRPDGKENRRNGEKRGTHTLTSICTA